MRNHWSDYLACFISGIAVGITIVVAVLKPCP